MSLAVFFTQGVSLRTWADAGIVQRETALYKRLLPHVGSIDFVTYGDLGEHAFDKELGGIRVLPNRWKIPYRIYRRTAAFTHAPSLARASIWKTNQTSGAVAALPARRLFRKPLIVRAGFLWSRDAAYTYGENSAAARDVFESEGRYFRAATVAVVTEPSMREFVVGAHGVPPCRVRVIPNYVDTDLFAPTELRNDDGRTVCFVGRLTKQKNLEALLEAIKGLDVRLRLIGQGEDKVKLEAFAKDNRLDVDFMGRIPHEGLPEVFRSSTLFVLPSLWEGHPKALLEAMATGLPVVGAASPGIDNLLTHGANGYVCDPSPSGIRVAIESVLGDAEVRKRIGQAGKDFVVQNFSLERIAKLELDLYRELS